MCIRDRLSLQNKELQALKSGGMQQVHGKTDVFYWLFFSTPEVRKLPEESGALTRFYIENQSSYDFPPEHDYVFNNKQKQKSVNKVFSDFIRGSGMQISALDFCV